MNKELKYRSDLKNLPVLQQGQEHRLIYLFQIKLIIAIKTKSIITNKETIDIGWLYISNMIESISNNKNDATKDKTKIHRKRNAFLI